MGQTPEWSVACACRCAAASPSAFRGASAAAAWAASGCSGLLAAGGIGALIVYLVNSGRQGAAFATSVPATAPGGGSYDLRRQQFEQWQQFEEWHRQTHGAAAPEAPTAPLPEPDAPTDAQLPR